jgi:hypothetical protein
LIAWASPSLAEPAKEASLTSSDASRYITRCTKKSASEEYPLVQEAREGTAGLAGTQAGVAAGGTMGAAAGGITGWGVGMAGGTLIGLIVGIFLGLAIGASSLSTSMAVNQSKHD